MKQETKKKHSRILRSVTAFLLCALTLLYAVPKWSLVLPVKAASVAEDKQKVKLMEDELAALKGNRSTANTAYQDALNAYNATVYDLDLAKNAKIALDLDIQALEKEIEKTNELFKTYNEQLEYYEQAVAEKQLEIDDRYGKFVERIRINYEDSFTSYLEIVLTSDSFSDLLYRVDVVASLLDYDKRVLKALDQSKKDLAALLSDYQTLQYKTSETLDEMNNVKMPELELKKEENAELLAKLDALFLEAKENKEITEAQKAQIDAQVAKKEREIAVAEASIAQKIKEAQEAERIANYVGGPLDWPVDLKYNRISSYFVMRTNPIYGYREQHNGIDIPVPYGTSVKAANSGTVIVAEYHYSYGNYVVVDHGGGISTLYAHNSKLLVKVGDQVSRGDTIAKAGSTGCSTGNHVHFTVRENGTPVDPLNGYVTQP